VRGLEFLRDRPEVMADRIGVVGDDLALITAARRAEVRVAQLTGSMFYRLSEARHQTDAYPIEEVNDYLRADPEAEEAVNRTLAYFDPVHHAPNITATTQIPLGRGTIGGEAWMRPLVDAIAGPTETYALTNKGGIDHDATESWLSGQLGVPARPRLWSVA
jgi:cephalosporin-C deacetylase-like acetyl esterase